MLFGFTAALLYWVFLVVLVLVFALALFLPVGAIFEWRRGTVVSTI
jgi:hypothetical protein